MKLLTTLALAGLLSLGTAAFAANAPAAAKPTSVIHIVTVKWKDGTTAEQIKAALDGAQKLPEQYKGITRVWTNAIKVQNPPEVKEKPKTHVIVMEFVDQQALKDYTDSPAQLEWYKVYADIRDQSTTFDVTN